MSDVVDDGEAAPAVSTASPDVSDSPSGSEDAERGENGHEEKPPAPEAVQAPASPAAPAAPATPARPPAPPGPPAPPTTPAQGVPAAPLTPAPPRTRRRAARRTWPQRLVLGFNVVVVLACVAAATALRYGYDTVNRTQRVVLDRSPDIVHREVISRDKNGNIIPGFNEAPVGDLPAQNFLLVGVDQRGCQPSNPQYAGAFGEGGGTNTDTIMVLRTEPDTDQAAILSFPRDLWVKVPGGSQRAKINSFLTDPNDPTPLQKVIGENFGITIDHYIAVDFCGFRDLVNAVGPVRIPFAYPARDRQTGLDIREPGCYDFDGDAALAYARSRHYQWQDEEGHWHDDDTSDFGRQARQQDFVRRVLRKVVDSGGRDPGKLQQLVRIGLEYVTVDEELTPQNIYDLGRAFKDLDPNSVRSFSIEGTAGMRGDTYVLTYDLQTSPNLEVVQVFSGLARMAALNPPADGALDEAAATPAGPTATDSPGPASSAAPAPGAGEAAAGAATTVATGSTLPEVSLPATNSVNDQSIVPPDDPACT